MREREREEGKLEIGNEKKREKGQKGDEGEKERSNFFFFILISFSVGLKGV